ncbi:MAG TPA: ABC transporter permease [Candidatus Acidoferrum sp.]
MFWRIIRRLIVANRGRLLVILLALGTGAAVTAALLNLQVDAKRRLSGEFRAFGANIVIAPRNADNNAETSGTLAESVFETLPDSYDSVRVARTAYLYLIADAHVAASGRLVPVVVAGKKDAGIAVARPGSWYGFSRSSVANEIDCGIGTKAAAQLGVNKGGHLVLESHGRQAHCVILETFSTGGAEDSEIFLPLDAAQQLAGLPGRISLIQIGYSGTADRVTRYVAALAQRFAEADVHGIRQFTEGEAKIYDRISGLLTATVVLVLVLTGLCVMAAMTNVAMERQNDVGLMKAIGGATRRVLRLFLTEAALLGLAAGVIGAAGGILLSIGLGKEVFGVAARPRLIVYPISVALTVVVAILGAYPLRRLANIRPASVFRGEA